MNGPFDEEDIEEEPARDFGAAMNLFKDEEIKEEPAPKKKKQTKVKSKSDLITSFNRSVEPVTFMCVYLDQYQDAQNTAEEDRTEEQNKLIGRYHKFVESFKKAVSAIRNHGEALLEIAKSECADNELMLKVFDMISDDNYQEMHVFQKAPAQPKKIERIQDVWTGQIMDCPQKNQQNFMVFNSKSDEGSSQDNYTCFYIHKDGGELVRVLHTILNFSFYMYNTIKMILPTEIDTTGKKWSEVWKDIVGEEFKETDIQKWTKKKSIANDSFVSAVLKMRSILDATDK